MQCNTCGGRYQDVQIDGMRYFHVCPPLSVPELQAARAEGRLTLPAADEQQLTDAEAADAKNPLPSGKPSRAQVVLARIVVDRPAKRDENVVQLNDEARTVVKKAEGAGAVVVTDAPDDAASVRPRV